MRGGNYLFSFYFELEILSFYAIQKTILLYANEKSLLFYAIETIITFYYLILLPGSLIYMTILILIKFGLLL